MRIERDCACGRPHARPRLPGLGVEASVTHAGEAVAVAVAVATGVDEAGADDSRADEAGIGLDVEPREASVAGLDHVVLADGESADGPLLAVWVRKEAALKAIGTGLRRPMTSLRLGAAPDGAPHGARAVHGDDLPPSLRVLDLAGAPGHLAALALSGAPRPVRERDAADLLAAR